MKVAVIGAGIQGTCVALELARREIDVDLIEAKSSPMEGASRHSEGKIHLGFVYANDASFRTADLQMRGAAVFGRLMREWLGTEFDDVPISTAFNYAVHEQSLIPPERLTRIYQEISSRIGRCCDDGAYFGAEHPGQVERLSEGDAQADYGKNVSAVFSTKELAIDPDSLADLIVKRVTEVETITLYANTKVTEVHPAERRISVSTEGSDRTTLERYDHIINCAWEGRPAIDATVGLHQLAPWSFRMKYFLKGMTGLPLPSTTIVLGPFGDIAEYATGDQYLAWYPSGRRGWSTDLTPPPWPTRPLAKDTSRITRDTLAHLSDVVPAVSGVPLDSVDVRGGVIYALGQTDVDDPASQLHERSNVGTTTLHGWYHSIDTGKYTTAPLFAREVVNRVTEAD